MSSTEYTPKLRFKDGSHDQYPSWKQKYLGSICTIVGGGTPSTEEPDYWGGTIQWFTPTELKSKYVSKSRRSLTNEGLKHSSAKLLPAGTVLFSSRATIGDVSIALDECSTNQGFQSLNGIKGITDNEFLYYWISRSKNEFLRRSSGSTFLEISKNEMLKVALRLPCLKEQQKIAAFLSKVDEKIALLTEKKDKLTEYKRGVMQQLFNGRWETDESDPSRTTFIPPTLRFKADDGSEFPDWEEKRLGELAEIRRGASPRPISDPKWFNEESHVGWVRISDVTRSGKELLRTEQYLTEEGIAKSRLVPVGSMIMSICATIGKPIYTTFPVCIHDGFVVFLGLKTDKQFLYFYLSMIEKRWYRYGQPGTQVNLNSDIVSGEHILLPSQAEQEKIATFLATVDAKIEAADAELKLAKDWKKGLLQQMFV